jgi:hypothetical protein
MAKDVTSLPPLAVQGGYKTHSRSESPCGRTRTVRNCESEERLNQWQTQWLRVCRYASRVEAYHQGKASRDIHPTFFEDDILGFFMLCCHLRDWLECDPPAFEIKGERWRKTVRSFVHRSEPLSHCLLICNATKHRNLDDKHRKWDPVMRGLNACWWDASDTQSIYCRFRFIPVNGNDQPEMEIHAHELARQCMGEWFRFIAAHYPPPIPYPSHIRYDTSGQEC